MPHHRTLCRAIKTPSDIRGCGGRAADHANRATVAKQRSRMSDVTAAGPKRASVHEESLRHAVVRVATAVVECRAIALIRGIEVPAID